MLDIQKIDTDHSNDISYSIGLENQTLPLSERQFLFFEYLIKKIGFSISDSFLPKYIELLLKHLNDYKALAAVDIKRNAKGELILPKDDIYKNYEEKYGVLIPSKFKLIDLLNLETNIRERKKYKKKKAKSAIAATDISNFTYCPVSFSISRSFYTKKLTHAHIGASFHKKYKLLDFTPFIDSEGKKGTALKDKKLVDRRIDYFDEAEQLMQDIKDSTAVYVGAPNRELQFDYFIGKDKTYVGQPDYIFINKKTKKYFVVEEKFHFIPREISSWAEKYGHDVRARNRIRNSAKYFDNHLNQLRSYINEIHNYEISYGYLLYWRYSFQKNEEGFNGLDDFSLFSGEKSENKDGLVIEQAFAKKIRKSSKKDKDLYQMQYNNIKNLIKNGEMRFDKNFRNPAKCGGCVVSILCGHKTGNYDSFSFPYSEKYLNTKYVEFPFVKIFHSGAIIRKGRAILIARRSENQKLAGLWEIPGWRKARNINDKTFLIKALKINLNIDVEVGKLFYSYPYKYRKYNYDIKYYNLIKYRGSIKSSLYDKFEWANPGNLDDSNFLNSMHPLIWEINNLQYFESSKS